MQAFSAKEAAAAGEVAPSVPARAVGGGGWPRPQILLELRQNARLEQTFTELDLFSRLSAAQEPVKQSAVLSELAESDAFVPMIARISYGATLILLDADDELPQLTARRGLPNKTVLAWFLEEVA